MSLEAEFLASLESWLGADAVLRSHAAVYLREIESIADASSGRLPGRSPSASLGIARSVADGFAARWLRPHQAQSAYEWATVFSETDQGAPVRAARMTRRVDLNTAGLAELADLPGLGRTTAARIIALRSRSGALNSIEDLKGIQGISRKKREALAPLVTTNSPAPPMALTRGDLGSAPIGFARAMRIFRDSGLLPAPVLARLGAAERPSLPALTRAALAVVAAEASASPYWSVGRSGDARAALDVEPKPVLEPSPASVGVLRNSQYLEFVEELIRSASARVLVQMFFLSSHAAGTPGARLLSALAEVAQQGRDVRVILDTEPEFDLATSDELNDPSQALLTAAGVEVRRDLEGTKTHSKILIVDGEHVVLGSHNWTTSSMYFLDETSLYMRSEAVVARELERFERLWKAYHPDPAQRAWHLSVLRYPRAAELEALASAGIHDSSEFTNRARTASRVPFLADEIGLDPERLTVLWRIVRLMLGLNVAEHVAAAFAATEFNAPSEVRRASKERRRAAIALVTPLAAPYAGALVREEVLDEL